MPNTAKGNSPLTLSLSLSHVMRSNLFTRSVAIYGKLLSFSICDNLWQHIMQIQLPNHRALQHKTKMKKTGAFVNENLI